MKPPSPLSGTVSLVPHTARTQAESPHLLPDQINKGRADFRPERFEALIQKYGYHLTWRKALLCPCRSAQTDQARVDCLTCDSSGYFFIEPIEIQGLMTGLESKKGIYRNLGEWLDGSAVITTTAANRIGHRDSLTMQHSIMTFNEWIVKGNRHGIRSRLPANTDVCRYRIIKLLHMLYEMDEQPVAVQEGVHFKITKQGWIEWIGLGLNIPDKTNFSVHYEFHPVWVVINHPHAVRDTVVKVKQPTPTVRAMPLQVAVKLDYLLDGKTLPSVLTSDGSDKS